MHNNYASYWFLFLLLHTVESVTCFAENGPDGSALMAVKTALEQDPHGALSSWNEPVHFCEWRGVLCSRHRQRVIGLDLRSHGLIGELSPHIGNLSFLQIIILQNNSFHGRIPHEISRLFRLRSLELSNNSFTGDISHNISNCSKLSYLNLIDNDLSGTIPTELGSLSNLAALGLSRNKFSGIIPPSLGNLSLLSVLSLRECGLQGEIPPELALLRRLTYFQLTENNFTGKFPQGIYNISSINFLSLSFNAIQGTIPPDIGRTLPKLRHFDVGMNQFSGGLPPSLSNASGLENIIFSSNYFSGPMISGLEKLSMLKGLYASSNSIDDDFNFIKSLTNCSSLRGIDVAANLLRGGLPDSIANLSSSSLEFISMGGNEMNGSIPPGIENVANITILSLEENKLSGRIPASIGKLQKLQVLNLNSNNLSQELPSSLGNLTSLNRINLGYNNFHGTIPQSLGNCRNLMEIDISSNSLQGSIPQNFLSLPSISISLNLSRNALNGSVPPQIGDLRNLGILDLSNNRLTGSVPNSISYCVSLLTLLLDNNDFHGEIPSGLSTLQGLEELDLSRNKFSGKIPRFLGDLALKKLDLSFNDLSGEVPTRGVFGNSSGITVNGNNELCGGTAKMGLPPCPSLNSKKKLLKWIIPVAIFIFFGGFTLTICWFVFVGQRRWPLFFGLSGKNQPQSEQLFDHQFLRVSYGDLLNSTDGFSEDNLIGAGGHGSVYRGTLARMQEEGEGQIEVAVKVLNLKITGAAKSFVSECDILRRTRHRNLLKVLSACSTIDFQGNDFKAVVFEYMANGSLAKWIHQPEAEERENCNNNNNWRFMVGINIAIDIASALEYLHNGGEDKIVHGDLKPSIVLLDNNMRAYVGDFGLAKIISAVSGEFASSTSASSSSVHRNFCSSSIAVVGTVGYVPPEYGMGGLVSTQGDVYSYGILLLEMMTGKSPTDEEFKDGYGLHNLVHSCLPDQAMRIVDPHHHQQQQVIINGTSDKTVTDSIVSALRIGVACAMESPRDRMEMSDVVAQLQKIQKVLARE